jgi:hypothetical protein
MALAGTRLDYKTQLPREHASKPGTGCINDLEIQANFSGGYAAMRPGLRRWQARRPGHRWRFRLDLIARLVPDV